MILCSGQWATRWTVQKSEGVRLDGLELACRGEHFPVDEAAAAKTCCGEKREIPEKRGLKRKVHEKANTKKGRAFQRPPLSR
jgi:hypothetical protein